MKSSEPIRAASKELVLSSEGAFQRVGETVRPMSPSNISVALAQKKLPPNERDPIAEGIAQLTKMVGKLQGQLEHANSFRGQARNYIIRACADRRVANVSMGDEETI